MLVISPQISAQDVRQARVILFVASALPEFLVVERFERLDGRNVGRQGRQRRTPPGQKVKIQEIRIQRIALGAGSFSACLLYTSRCV